MRGAEEVVLWARYKHDVQHDGRLPQSQLLISGVFFFLGEDVVVAGFAPACTLLGSAIGAHVLSYNQDRPSS